MNKRKTSKRRYMTVVQGEKGDPTPGYGGGGSIYRLSQYFTLRFKHLKGSNRPQGWFHQGYASDTSVEVRWLWNEAHQFFAPEIQFRPSKLGTKTAVLIAGALQSIQSAELEGPDLLADTLGAVVVDYLEDNKEGCWNDYQPLRIPGEPAMVTIARHAL